MSYTNEDHPEQRGSIIASVMLASVLAAFAVLGIWNRPLADDSCIIAAVERVGVIGYVQETWWNWTGNVPSLFLQGIGTTTGWYPVWPAVLLAVWGVGFIWLAHEAAKLLRIDTPRWALIAAGLALAVAVNDMTDNKYQTLYWLTGTFAYALPAALTLFLFAVQLRAVRLGIRRLHVLAVILLSFVIGACSPTNAAFLLVLLVVGWLGALVWARGPYRRRMHVLTGTTAVGAVAAAIIILASPGNALRQAALAEFGIYRQSFLQSILDSFLFALIIIERTVRVTAPVTHIALIVLGIGSALVYRPEVLRYRAGSRLVGRLGFPLLLASGLLITAAAVFPAAFSTGNLPEPRLWVIPQGIWVILVFGLSYLVGLSVTPPRSDELPRIRTVLFIAITVLCGAQIPDFVDQLQSMRTYALDFDKRYDLVTAAVADNVESLDVPAYSISVYEFARLGNAFEDSCWQQRFPRVRLDFRPASD